jgi:hypothetical protein
MAAKRKVLLEDMIVTQLVRIYRLLKIEDELVGLQELDSGPLSGASSLSRPVYSKYDFNIILPSRSRSPKLSLFYRISG